MLRKLGKKRCTPIPRWRTEYPEHLGLKDGEPAEPPLPEIPVPYEGHPVVTKYHRRTAEWYYD